MRIMRRVGYLKRGLEGAFRQEYFLRGFPFGAVARDFDGDALDQHARDLEGLYLALLARVQVRADVRMLEQVLKFLRGVVHDEEQI